VPFVGRGRKASTVCLRDRADTRQSHAASPQLCGVERVEEPLRLPRAEPDVPIPYGEENRVRRAGPLLHAQCVREVDMARVALLARTQSPKLRIVEMQARMMAEPLVWPLKAHSL
jgi:hypothetical protein